jgi:hypothetical protein
MTGTQRRTTLGGRGPVATGATAPDPIRPVNDPRDELPTDLAALAAAAGVTGAPAPEVSRETTPPQTAPAVQPPASPLASGLAGQQANKGNPNVGEAPRSGPPGPQISIASMLRTAPRTPEQDTHNPGWRYPRYIYNVVRLLAFQLRADQQEVAKELLYSAMLNAEPGGVLNGVPRSYIVGLLNASYDESAKALGANSGY